MMRPRRLAAAMRAHFLAFVAVYACPAAGFNSGGFGGVCIASGAPLQRVSSRVHSSGALVGTISQQQQHSSQQNVPKQWISRIQCEWQARCNLEMSAGPVPSEVRSTCARVAAVLFGSNGAPTWPDVLKTQHKLCERAVSQASMSGEYVFPEGTCYETRGECLKTPASEGDVRAQHSLGLLYYGGYGGLEQSDELSAMWHAAAAAGGNWDAVAVLGGCLRKGSGVEKDTVLGRRLISLSSAAGNPSGILRYLPALAVSLLAWLIKAGGLLEEQGDLQGALVLYQQAAEQNNALALFCVGWAMLDREWKAATKAVGIARSERAADASEEAAYHLALRLRNGAISQNGGAKGGEEEASTLMQLSRSLGFRS